MGNTLTRPEGGSRPGLLVSLGRWGLALLTSVGLAAACVVAHPLSPRLAHWLRGAWGRTQLRIFGIRVRVEDRNAGAYGAPPYLFVLMNQTSLAEAFVMPVALPVPGSIFLNLEFALVPFVGWASWLMGGVLVVRQWPAQARRAGQKANRLLERGRSFYISIEGRRSPDGALLPYKKGPVVMALTTGARFIPVYVRGARSVWPHGEWRVRPGEVSVVLGEPVPLAGRGLEERGRLVAELEALARAELTRDGVT